MQSCIIKFPKPAISIPLLKASASSDEEYTTKLTNFSDISNRLLNVFYISICIFLFCRSSHRDMSACAFIAVCDSARTRTDGSKQTLTGFKTLLGLLQAAPLFYPIKQTQRRYAAQYRKCRSHRPCAEAHGYKRTSTHIPMG